MVGIGYKSQKFLGVEETKRHMRGGGAERGCKVKLLGARKLELNSLHRHILGLFAYRI